MPVPQDLLAILACPRCRGPLEEAAPGEGIVCPRCRLCFPVREGIPLMIVEEASPWPQR